MGEGREGDGVGGERERVNVEEREGINVEERERERVERMSEKGSESGGQASETGRVERARMCTTEVESKKFLKCKTPRHSTRLWRIYV